MKERSDASGITYFDLGNEGQGIVHVIGPELGLTQPGMTIVCGDSHTCTHGGLGALSFGIGATEIMHVLATQTLRQVKPKTMRIVLDGNISPGVAAKDVILPPSVRSGPGPGAATRSNMPGRRSGRSASISALRSVICRSSWARRSGWSRPTTPHFPILPAGPTPRKGRCSTGPAPIGAPRPARRCPLRYRTRD